MQIFLIIWMIRCKNFAILLNSSIGFSNYRHYSNIACIHDLLIKGGLNEKEIVLFQSKNASNSPKNLKKKGIYFGKNLRKYLSPWTNSEEKLDLINLMKAVEGKNSKLHEIDKNSNIFIYFCGHACKEFLKIQNKNFIFPGNLTPITENFMQKSQKGICDSRHLPCRITCFGGA